MQKAVENALSVWPGCPVCLGRPLDQWLLQQDDRAVKIHHCPQCSGMWLEPDAVLALRSTPLEM